MIMQIIKMLYYNRIDVFQGIHVKSMKFVSIGIL